MSATGPMVRIQDVHKRFGKLDVDLAASAENAKAPVFVTKEEDSLSVGWAERWPSGNLWLNPEFADIAPWAAKCREETCHRPWRRYGFIFLLTPASIGSEWYATHVHGSAYTMGLSPRLTFEGTSDPYPKDLMLSIYGYGLIGFGAWRWNK